MAEPSPGRQTWYGAPESRRQPALVGLPGIQAYGPTTPQALAYSVGRFLAAAAGILTGAAVRDHFPGWLLVFALPVYGIAAVLFCPLVRKQGLSTTPYVVAVRRGYGTRRVSWANVEAVDIGGWLGVRRLVLHTRDGTLRPVWPRTSPLLRDREFDAKAAEVRETWEAYRRWAQGGRS